MFNRVMETMKKWLTANKYELWGFAAGMAVVVAAAGVYRISWEFSEKAPAVVNAPTTPQPASAVSRIPTPQRAPGKEVPPPQQPTRARPVLKKLDGPPEALRRLREQQSKPATP